MSSHHIKTVKDTTYLLETYTLVLNARITDVFCVFRMKKTDFNIYCFLLLMQTQHLLTKPQLWNEKEEKCRQAEPKLLL